AISSCRRLGGSRCIGAVRLKVFLKTVTICREADGWYVAISCAEVPVHPLPPTGQETRIDLGLDSFATHPRWDAHPHTWLLSPGRTLSGEVPAPRREMQEREPPTPQSALRPGESAPESTPAED
ncbi:MAG TPA: hypothetical protein VGP82_02665, partial [Ktedonobacterales bacterium]|nr:hypothetical protein [Ktedonobacterales bacterium]